ncbi:hypothetical protein EGH24_03310 [Halonotius terrestris]|uniref:Uncharacterized protein n=1 Tax=Halonotius terrestris TaxID=2487750 RepID=A0A8J8PEG5_9EURY|nr:hypothetical protein [Halonotius terrestris]TQQ83820.1 hypothetical protein EGH24_03310 [Halonotius terrestris]
MADPAAAQSPPDVVVELRAAADRVQAAEAAIAEHGEASVEAAADAYRNATRLLDSYEGSATGTGDFTAYLQFQSEILALVESLPDDAFAADAFQRVSDRLDKRRLNEADFEFAREEIETAGEAVEMLEEREDAIAAYREARSAAKTALDDRREEADRLRDLQRLADVDLDISVEPLRERTEAYNAAVRAAFDRFRTERSARELFDLLGDAADRPLVGVDRPPRHLVEYIDSKPAGTEPLATLVEYADYSPSKLDHYVDDPGALRTSVAVHQTYLDRLDAEPFCVDWPPAEAATLRARLDELAPLVRRLDSVFEADDDDAGDADAADDDVDDADTPADDAATDDDIGATNRIEAARRRLARFTRRDEYERLREVAVAETELDDDEFERVASGAVDDDLAVVTEEIDRIETALAETDID